MENFSFGDQIKSGKKYNKTSKRLKEDGFKVPRHLYGYPYWKQKILIQEYYVNPSHLDYFAEHIKEPADIERVRGEFRGCLAKSSTIEAGVCNLPRISSSDVSIK